MERYLPQLLYKNIGKSGQKKLRSAKISIIGVGALGTIVAEILVRSGVGSLMLVDRDYVEFSNLHRQFLFTEEDVGKAKAHAASERLSAINKETNITAKPSSLSFRNISIIERPSLIMGCTDNMESRLLLNDYALKNKIPYIVGGAVTDIGFVYVVHKNACLRCFYDKISEETCTTSGILSTCSAIAGIIMANEAIKLIAAGECESSMLRFNIWRNEFEKIKTEKRKLCKACAGSYEYLNGEKGTKLVQLCGQGTYQVSGNKVSLPRLKKRLEKTGKVIMFKGILHYGAISVFEDGRAIVKSNTPREALSYYSKIIGN